MREVDVAGPRQSETRKVRTTGRSSATMPKDYVTLEVECAAIKAFSERETVPLIPGVHAIRQIESRGRPRS